MTQNADRALSNFFSAKICGLDKPSVHSKFKKVHERWWSLRSRIPALIEVSVPCANSPAYG